MNWITELISKMGASDWISIFALVISVVVGIINYGYTRRTFAAAYFPRAHFSHKVKTCVRGNCILLHVQNLSKDHAMMYITGKITIFSPRKWLIFRPQRKTLELKEIASLQPMADVELARIPANTQTNLEELLVESFPEWIQPQTSTLNGKFYQLVGKGKARIRISLNYTPGVMGAERVPMATTFTLTPIISSENATENQIFTWEITS